MCGISGYCGHFNPLLLQQMNRIMAHRGPDGSGEWHDPASGVGLAHRRLAIIDLSAGGSQPMVTADQRFVISFNGEIYNYRELKDELESRGSRFRSHSDTEVLLEMYRAYGREMFSRLNGMFAFALWDSAERSLLLARDGLGVKPLYYAQTSGGFLFASEIKALLMSQEVSREIDHEAIAQYLALLWSAAPRTAFRQVRKLEPGTAMIVREGRVAASWKFYDQPYDGERTQDAPPEIAKRVAEAVRTAVGRQMVSDVPVGAFLSGGLDSSAVVAMMRRVRPDYRPACYSIGFRDEKDLEGSPNDLPYARVVAKHTGVDLREVIVGPEIIGNLDRMIYHMDEPQADPAPINVMLISEQARAEGIKVLLSGAGGDDIFSGYRRHAALRVEKLWGWLPPVARASLAAFSHQLDSRSRWGRRIKRSLVHAALPPEERLLAYFLWSDQRTRNEIFTPEFLQSLGDASPLDPLRQSLEAIPAERDSLNRMLYLESKHFLADHNLSYTDRLSMACGVEVRVPLLDPDLVRLATRIPPGLKQRGQTGKYIFKKAMEPYLPREVIWRPKTGFGAPVRRWLHTELRELVSDTLSDARLRQRGLFQPEAVRRLIEADRNGRADAAYLIYAILCLEIWFQKFVDRPAPNAI